MCWAEMYLFADELDFILFCLHLKSVLLWRYAHSSGFIRAMFRITEDVLIA